MLTRHFNRPIRFAKCAIVKGQELVQSGLSNTPAQLYEMAQQGKPISASILPDDMFDDGQPYCSNEIPIDFQRGIDVNQMWNLEKDTQAKFKEFSKKNHVSKQPQNE